MKLADIVSLKEGRPVSGASLPASLELLSLSATDISALPECFDIVDADRVPSASASVSRELLLYLLQRGTPEILAEILDNGPAGVVAIDDDSRIFYVNKAYTKTLGIPRQRVLGKRMLDIEPDAMILEVLHTRQPVVDDVVHVQSVDRYVRVNIAPFFRNGKPWGAVSLFTDVTENTRLTKALDRASTLANHFRQELDKQRELPGSFSDMIGRNKKFLRALQMAGTVAATDAPVLILGEHGVGKEVLARAVYAASPRSGKAFIPVNCAAIPDALLESELFGYEEGAFTGARRGGAVGKFELADGGVLFLDEIGDMPLSMQAKLLRALQEKEVEKLGRSKSVPVDVRVIAATNRDLKTMVRGELFRADLYYRLNMVTITIPPLRARLDDIGLLAADILAKCCRKYGKTPAISPQLYAILHSHSWPGNVRELANILEYAVIMCPGSLILPEHLPAQFMEADTQGNGQSGGNAATENDPTTPAPATGGIWKEVLGRTERDLLRQVLEACKGNRSEAIRRLGISRKAFYDKLHLYHLV